MSEPLPESTADAKKQLRRVRNEGLWGWLRAISDFDVPATGDHVWPVASGLFAVYRSERAFRVVCQYAPGEAMPPVALGLTRSGSAEVIAATRLDKWGRAELPAEPGACRIRITAHVRDALDVAVLRKLGDDRAKQQLEMSRANPFLPKDVFDEPRAGAPAAAEGERSFPLTELPAGARLRGGELRVEREDAPDAPLVRVTVRDQSGELSTGFIGFARVRRNEDAKKLAWMAEAKFGVLFPAVTEITARVSIQFGAQTVETLRTEDYLALVRSFDAATSRCKSALASALSWVRHAHSAELPAVELPGKEPVAVLPTSDEELRALAQRSLSAVSKPRLGNGEMLTRAQEHAFGQCALDRFDRVRWLDAVIAAMLDAMAQAISPAQAPAATETMAGTRTTFATCATNPDVVRRRLDRLAELEAADAESALAGKLFRLSEFAEKTEAQSAVILGLPVDEVKWRLEYAKSFLAADSALPA